MNLRGRLHFERLWPFKIVRFSQGLNDSNQFKESEIFA